MGRLQKKFNWRARQVVNTSISETKASKVKVELQDEKFGAYDDCNALVLPSKKRETKQIKPSKAAVTKTLSKKQRKHLEKIVERKKKKENRSNLLEALSKVQAPDDVLNQLTSITEVQTRGLKRLREIDEGFSNATEDDGLTCNIPLIYKKRKICSISGSLRKQLSNETAKITKDPNIVGFEISDEETDEVDEDEDEDDEVEEKEASETNEDKISISEEDLSCKDTSNGVVENCDNSEISSTCNNTNSNYDINCIDNKLLKVSTDSCEEKQVIFRNTWTVSKVDSPKSVNGIDKAIVNNECDKQKSNSNGSIKTDVKPALFVPVDRIPELQEARLKLPILCEEQMVMETINEHPIVIIAGETGSGKTTQVPQFLYEAGYALNGRMIGITEPRRVAAISMSQRVGEELNLPSSKVSYLIRFEGNVTPDTQIKFMTDGVLLKEIQTDFLLTKYSVIILDEAHERSVYTDILIGFLSRIVPLRNKRNNPLKLIIMSATLRISDFTENKRLFKVPPPVVKVDSRQYPVCIHFNKRTNPDYIREAYRKACKIHTQLPEGGILIFVTGQQEVNMLVKKLRNAFPLHRRSKKSKGESDDVKEGEKLDDQLGETLKKQKRLKKTQTGNNIVLPEIDLSKYSLVPNDDTEGDVMDEGDDSEAELDDDVDGDEFAGGKVPSQPLWVLPLYSLLPGYKQAKVFEQPPEGCRLCVVATNIAETSLTIPHVKYVVDSGKVKTKVYDKHTGVSAFTVLWTSKAAANQRAGRAGRTGPGHCYRLYSSAVFNDTFEDWSIPEIRKQPVDDLVLQLKAIGINKVINFPFPSPPDNVQLNMAGRRLSLLGALPQCSRSTENWNSKLTELGEAMSIFPVSPRFAKMLCLSHQHNLMEYTITIVAALSVQELLLLGEQKWAMVRRKWAGVGNSFFLGDVMVLLRAVGASEYANSHGDMERFCTDNGLRLKAVLEVRKLRLQLSKEINIQAPELNLFVNPKMPPPSDQQAKQLRQIVLAGLVDQVARRVPDEEAREAGIRKGKAVYRTIEMEDFVYIHPHSALYKEQPEWVVYQQISEMSKTYMIGTTAIEPEWLPVFAPTLCNLTPLTDPPPRFNQDTGTIYCFVSGTFGRGGWHLPDSEVEFPSGVERHSWFAVFLLDGTVCPQLEKYAKHLLSTPSCMVKSWSRLLPRTRLLLKALVDKEVGSRDKLLACWGTDSKYLLNEYLAWLPESVHNEIISIWPPT